MGRCILRRRRDLARAHLVPLLRRSRGRDRDLDMRTATALLAMAMCEVASAIPNCDSHMDDDRIALACNLYYEASTEGYQGMVAIVAVTMNRVDSKHYPNTVREVVWERKQFSWTHDGQYDTPRNRRIWKQALAIASRFTISKEKREDLCGAPTPSQIMAEILGRPDPGEGCDLYDNLVNVHVYLAQEMDPTDGALFYHATYVYPDWADPRFVTTVIKTHVFYAKAL